MQESKRCIRKILREQFDSPIVLKEKMGHEGQTTQASNSLGTDNQDSPTLKTNTCPAAKGCTAYGQAGYYQFNLQNNSLS